MFNWCKNKYYDKDISGRPAIPFFGGSYIQ